MPRRDQVPVGLDVAIDALRTSPAGWRPMSRPRSLPRDESTIEGAEGEDPVLALAADGRAVRTGRLRCIALPRDTGERAPRSEPDLAWCVLEVLVSRIRG